MLRKSGSPLIRWFDTAVACRSDLCLILTSQNRVRRTKICSLCLSHGRVIVVDPPPPAESMGNQVGLPPMPRPVTREDGHPPAC